MTVPALTYDELKALNPCKDSLHRVAKLMGGAKTWNGKKITAEQARKSGATCDDIIWAASAAARNDDDVERRLRFWVADCAARVLHIYEAAYPTDTRPRDAITAARQYARGEIGADARAAAWDAASAAASAAAWADASAVARAAARDAASAAASAAAWADAWADASAAARAAASAAARADASAAAWGAALADASAVARAAARAAASAAASAAAWGAALAAEQQWQFDRIVLWLSKNEPGDWPLPVTPKER